MKINTQNEKPNDEINIEILPTVLNISSDFQSKVENLGLSKESLSNFIATKFGEIKSSVLDNNRGISLPLSTSFNSKSERNDISSNVAKSINKSNTDIKDVSNDIKDDLSTIKISNSKKVEEIDFNSISDKILVDKPETEDNIQILNNQIKL